MPEPKFDPRIHHRQSIRLQGFDYSSAGAYFVTIVAHEREGLFGEVVDGNVKLNRFGEIVNHAWFDLPRHYRHVTLGAFVIMPNHVHGIIVLNDDGRGGSISGVTVSPDMTIAGQTSPPANPETRYVPIKRHPLSEIVRAFKSFSAKRINVLRRTQGIPVWQRNYYEHIIRNDREMERIWHYIESNPSMWTEDDENPLRLVTLHMPCPRRDRSVLWQAKTRCQQSPFLVGTHCESDLSLQYPRFQILVTGRMLSARFPL